MQAFFVIDQIRFGQSYSNLVKFNSLFSANQKITFQTFGRQLS